MLSSELLRGGFFAVTELAEGALKAGGLKEFARDIPKGGLINGNVRNAMKYAATAVAPIGLVTAGIFGIRSGASAPRGKVASKGFASMTATIGADVIGGLAGGPLGALAAQMVLAHPLQELIEKPIEAFQDLHKNTTKLKMGGSYEDTEVAYTMRQRAAQELGSSLLNARHHLGREAMLMHQ